MDGSWTLGMNGFFSKSEEKTFPRELAISDRNLNNWKLLRIKDMDLWKGERDFFLRLDLGPPSKFQSTLQVNDDVFSKNRDVPEGFFPPILVVKSVGNATKPWFHPTFADFAELSLAPFWPKKSAQVLHHWICSLVPIGWRRVFFYQSVVFNLEFFSCVGRVFGV